MVREAWFQSQVTSYQRLLKWYLIPPCLTLSNIRYVSKIKWSNPGKGVAPSPTPRCSSYWKGSLLVAHNYYGFIIELYNLIRKNHKEFLCISDRHFSPIVSLHSRWYPHTVVLTRPQLGRNSVSFYPRNHICIWSITANSNLCLPNVYVDITFSRWDIAAVIYELVN